MLAGVFVLAAPIVVLAGAGMGIGKMVKNNKFEDVKIQIYRSSLRNLCIIKQILNLEYQNNDTNLERRKLLIAYETILSNDAKNLQKDLDVVESIDLAIIKNGIDN